MFISLGKLFNQEIAAKLLIWCWWIDMFKKIFEANRSRKKSRIIHRNLKAVAQHKNTDLAFIYVLSLRPLASFLNKHHCDLQMFIGMTEPNMKTTHDTAWRKRDKQPGSSLTTCATCPSTAPTETHLGKKRIMEWKKRKSRKTMRRRRKNGPNTKLVWFL